ncbi:hypothetical protein ACE01N_05985 [Saccharicrinis sp. FJH2]|uniref:hypothetical protein n=1 Tax=Saccharicrinis sp. FJH65 TaxID=3344659 RepID=UPI0035F24FBD
MDFTLKTYQQLLNALVQAGYDFQVFSDFITTKKTKTVTLRFDSEKNLRNTIYIAEILHEFNIRGTFYIRILKELNLKGVIEKLKSLNHEIGYHYDDLTESGGNFSKAIDRFKSNLSLLRTIAPVKTIVAEGAPLSKYDNRTLWQIYDYHDYGITGEPYFDVDFSTVLYLTDTGRRWDGYKVSVRDKILEHQERWEREGLVFHSTKDIIKAIQQDRLPDRIMFTFHPQRWHSSLIPWLKELILQRAKNVVKRVLVLVKNE